MANWTGVYTNPDSVGVSTGANGSNTLNDTGAVWPNLANQTLKITAGMGSGQERMIASSFPTQITIMGTWVTTPDATSHYEIVLVLKDGDHITGTFYLYPGMISELEDSATIYIDGNYKVWIHNATEVRWNKSKATLVTFEPNNRAIQGTFGFWLGIYLDKLATGTVMLSYVRVNNAATGIQLEPCIALGDGSGFHHLIADDCKTYPFGVWGAALTQDMKIKNVLTLRASGASGVLFPLHESAFSATFENFWSEKCRGTLYWGGATCSRRQIIRDSVHKDGFIASTAAINNALKVVHLLDNYLQAYARDAYIAHTAAGRMGSVLYHRNILKSGYEIVNSSSDANMVTRSRHNDFLGYLFQTWEALYNLGSGAETFTSHNDYIAGRNEAIPENIDVTELVTSNHTPPMYHGLTAVRTSAKGVPNKVLEIDNIRESDLTNSSVKIKFDCKNTNIGSTVDQDSASGQKVLFVANTDEFDEEETVEIGFGTVRFEEGVIDSINAGVSITLKANLTYTHTAGDADTVYKRLRNIGLGFIMYGISASDLRKSTHVPDRRSWGFLFTGFVPDIAEDDGHVWAYRDLEFDLGNLKSSTKYYYKAYAYTPLGDLMESSLEDFTTAASVDYTDPGEANVRVAVPYKFAGVDKLGVVNLPTEADVRIGVTYDNSLKTGLINLPIEGDVRLGVSYDNGTKTGTLPELTAAEIYTYFTDGSRADAFKADPYLMTHVGASYLKVTDTLKINAWLHKNGEIITTATAVAIVVFDDTGALFTLSSNSPDGYGVFWMSKVAPGFAEGKVYTLRIAVTSPLGVSTSDQTIGIVS